MPETPNAGTPAQPAPAPAPEGENPPKPPLGILPRRFHDEERANEIAGALARYHGAGQLPPAEWLAEYAEIVGRLRAETPTKPDPSINEARNARGLPPL